MKFNKYKLTPDAIDELADTYKKLNDKQKETIFRKFGEFLSINKKASGADGLDKEVKPLLIGAMLAELPEH